MRYIANKLTLSNKDKERMKQSLVILYQDLWTRGDSKLDEDAYKAYLVTFSVAVQLEVVQEDSKLKPYRR
jgi:hypothetical protein